MTWGGWVVMDTVNLGSYTLMHLLIYNRSAYLGHSTQILYKKQVLHEAEGEEWVKRQRLFQGKTYKTGKEI